jgi:hypothetical protein
VTGLCGDVRSRGCNENRFARLRSVVGTNRTNQAGLAMSVDRGKAEVAFGAVRTVVDPTETSNLIASEDDRVQFATRWPVEKCGTYQSHNAWP